jgi:hypothetical protein
MLADESRALPLFEQRGNPARVLGTQHVFRKARVAHHVGIVNGAVEDGVAGHLVARAVAPRTSKK